MSSQLIAGGKLRSIWIQYEGIVALVGDVGRIARNHMGSDIGVHWDGWPSAMVFFKYAS